MAWLGLSDTLEPVVRYRPLGSPWPTLNRVSLLYVYGRLVRGRGAYRVGTGVGYTGYWVGTTPLPPSTLPYWSREPRIGIARAQPVAGSAFLRPPWHSRALAGPSAHHGSSHSDTRPGTNKGEIRPLIS